MSAVDIYEDDEPEVLLSYNRKFISNLDVGNGTSPIYPGFSCAIDYRLQMLLTYFRTCVFFFVSYRAGSTLQVGNSISEPRSFVVQLTSYITTTTTTTQFLF